MTWLVTAPDTETGEVHVLPQLDLIEHSESEQCWCRPRRDVAVPNVFLHDSADRREDSEPTGLIH